MNINISFDNFKKKHKNKKNQIIFYKTDKTKTVREIDREKLEAKFAKKKAN